MDKLDECYGEETGRAFTQRKKLFLEYETETHTFSDMVYFKKAVDTGLMSRNREEERMNQKRRERKKERKKERRKERKKERKIERKKENKKEKKIKRKRKKERKKGEKRERNQS